MGWGPLLAVGVVAGVVLTGLGAVVVEATNSTQFCVSCHAMRSTVYPQYTASLHFDNPSGVRVGCADCHVPDDWGGKLLAKAQAVRDLLHTVLGTIDTPQKFNARHLYLANRVWTKMKADDSAQCRTCHSYQAMLFAKQDRKAAKEMRDAMKSGKTCIDCHKGVAHDLPQGYTDEYRREDEGEVDD